MSELQIIPFFISGNSLPHNLAYAATVEIDNTFTIIGGRSSTNNYIDTIYRYNRDNGQWVEEATTMSEAKTSMTAIKVKTHIFKARSSGKMPVEIF